ncbi:MAG: GntR family transcriptional regulator, partial [Paracoccaceae bacterium]
IYDRLKAAILIMDLEPGALLSEAEIGQAVGASRTPVRAALARLRDEGLIDTRPSRGNFVTRLSPASIRAAHLIRNAVERATVARLCAAPLRGGLAEKLERNLAASARALAAADGPEFRIHDDRFHLLLAEATALPRIAGALLREKTVLDRLRVLSLADTNHLRILQKDHEAIVAALLARDAEAANAALELHLARVLTTLGELERRNRDFFE